MNIQNRLLRIVHSKTDDTIIASDVRGRVHKFDADLNLLRSSPAGSYSQPINALCVTDKYIFTKDRTGTIGKWSLQTLMPLDFYEGTRLCDQSKLMDGEVPSPSPSRGIAYLNNRIYTNNGYMQIVVIDAETFELLDIRDNPAPSFLDNIHVATAELHTLGDAEGNVYIGNLESNDFSISVKVDSGVVHGVQYDKRHDRFWVTRDSGIGEYESVHTGIATMEKDGSNIREFDLSHEDVECIAFEPEHRYMYVAGFDGRISVFDNEHREFNLSRVIGPLRFQVISMAVSDAERIYVLLQTGDLMRMDSMGNIGSRASYEGSCVWTFEPHPNDDSLLYAGTDSGVTMLRYETGKFGNVVIRKLEAHNHGFPLVKDVRPFPDGSYIGISRNGYVFKADKAGSLQWKRQLIGVPRGIGINATNDRCMVSSDSGIVSELDASTGALIDQIELDGPSYGCAYTKDGRRVVTVDKNSRVDVYAADSKKVLGTIPFRYRLKRLFRRSNGELFVVGSDGMFELDLDNYEKRKSFGDFLINTKENGVLVDGHVYVGGYGYQVASYRYEDGEIIDLEEGLPDFTKAFAARVPEDGVPILLVGGRGSFINAYRIYDGVPHKVREFYLN
jgi:outer membrane protein assembly factor BamB